jgi:hypothetical protein
MKTGARTLTQRFFPVGVACILVAVLAACTGRGGGYLAPDAVYTGRALLGFSFSCQDSGGVNPPTGRLRIELTYADRGEGPTVSGPFSIHGIVDTFDDPVLESQICIGQDSAPGGRELIFLGRYRPTSTTRPAGFPRACPTRATPTSPLCRFEVIVRDNDQNLAPSKGDFFSIKLSSTTTLTSELDAATVFYTRAGLLAGGNLTVD